MERRKSLTNSPSFIRLVQRVNLPSSDSSGKVILVLCAKGLYGYMPSWFSLVVIVTSRLKTTKTYDKLIINQERDYIAQDWSLFQSLWRDLRTGSGIPDLKSLFTLHWTLVPFRVRPLMDLRDSGLLDSQTPNSGNSSLFLTLLNSPFQSRMEFNLTQFQELDGYNKISY